MLALAWKQCAAALDGQFAARRSGLRRSKCGSECVEICHMQSILQAADCETFSQERLPRGSWSALDDRAAGHKAAAAAAALRLAAWRSQRSPIGPGTMLIVQGHCRCCCLTQLTGGATAADCTPCLSCPPAHHCRFCSSVGVRGTFRRAREPHACLCAAAAADPPSLPLRPPCPALPALPAARVSCQRRSWRAS